MTNEQEIMLNNIENNIKKVIIGKDEQIKLLTTALITKSNVLIEDTPGTGKTQLAKALATSIDGSFKRVQFTPDLLPSDVTGINIYNKKEESFQFVAGPVFCNILLADEINRATPRTQSCLLEAMGEGQVTTDGTTRKLPEPFMLIATENPVETSGTFALPEAQLDRFDIKLSMGQTSEEESLAILDRYINHDPATTLAAICKPEDILSLQHDTKQIFIHDVVRKYIIQIIQATRQHESLTVGVSTRALLSLCKMAQGYAFLSNREYVIPEDVKYLAKPCLCHRLSLSASGYSNQVANSIMDDILKHTPVPTEDFN